MTDEEIRKIASAVAAALRETDPAPTCCASTATGDMCCGKPASRIPGGVVVCICADHGCGGHDG